ncbi:MAG: aminopeptidase [Candidatus Margulisiibacteriota bacterium]
MEINFIKKYASLLVNYCCKIQPGDRVLIRSTYLAEDLILACQAEVLKLGATCEFSIGLPNTNYQKYKYSWVESLSNVPILYEHSIKAFNVFISINAPFDLFELKGIDEEKLAITQAALKPIRSLQMQRSKKGELRWVICNYPTKALASAANMSLSDYEMFIFNACFLNKDNPNEAWIKLSHHQQKYTDLLTSGNHIHFKSPHCDIKFSIQDRIWINSDGQRNMPSGEIFTSPVEDSGDGTITFNQPSLLFGEVINNLTLIIKQGQVVSWDCTNGKALLDRLFEIDGANRIGEIAIGTNYEIKTTTLNTLFDEKIGGTIHMAVGASYPESGGLNVSSIHHDFVTSFDEDSIILLDDQIIYKNGKFV